MTGRQLAGLLIAVFTVAVIMWVTVWHYDLPFVWGM